MSLLGTFRGLSLFVSPLSSIPQTLGRSRLRRPVIAAPVHAVQHKAVKVSGQVGGRAKALNQRDRAAVSLVGLEPDLIEQMVRDYALHHPQHKRHQLGLCNQQRAQRDG